MRMVMAQFLDSFQEMLFDSPENVSLFPIFVVASKIAEPCLFRSTLMVHGLSARSLLLRCCDNCSHKALLATFTPTFLKCHFDYDSDVFFLLDLPIMESLPTSACQMESRLSNLGNVMQKQIGEVNPCKL